MPDPARPQLSTPPNPSPKPVTPQLRRWTAAIVTVFFVGGFGFASYLSRTPHVRDLLGASTAQMSLLALSLAIGSMLGMIAASHVDAALGPRRSMMLLVVVGQLGIALAAVGSQARSYPLTFAGLAAFGLGTGIVDVVMNVSAAAAEQERGRTIMPVFHAMFSLGTLAGAGIGALAERLGVPIGLHLGVIAALDIAAVVATNRWIQQPAPHEDSPQGLRGRLSAWTDRRTLLIGLVVLGMAMAEGSANDWLALTLVDGHGVTNSAGAVGLGIFLAAMTAVRLLGVRLIDRHGRVAVLRACAVVALVGLLLVIFVDAAAIAFVGCAVWGAGAALGFPLGMSAAADDPAKAAARVSVVSTIGYVAFLAGPPLIGFLGERHGLRNALLVVLVAALVAGLLSPAVREKRAGVRAH